MVNFLKPFEEITRHICGSKYSTLNLVYSYIRTLKNKFAPKEENNEFFEDWINLIYGPENLDTNSDSSLKLEDSNTVEYLLPVNCFGLLKKARAAIFLSIDKLWSTSNLIGLKASILDPRAIKLLPFATVQEHEETKAQVRAELLLLKTQSNILSNTKIERSPVTTDEDPQDSL
ncbi:24875_t:CDS:2, partial [Dentiscutata erythropus]